MKLTPIQYELNTPCDDCDHSAARFAITLEASPWETISLCADCAMELFWLLADNREKE